MLKIEAGGSAYGARVITDKSYSKGQLVHRISGYRITDRPTYQTIQIGSDAHIEELGVLAYLNHSCQPNTIIDTGALTVTAACDIRPGEELTFFYPSTEWELAQPFICLCKSLRCVRLVAGAKYLSIDTLSRYFINQHIRSMMFASLASAENSTSVLLRQ